MCGIFGKCNFQKEGLIDEEQIRSLTKLLEHRGPDDEGYFFDTNIGLGVRRLSVIDLKTGHQPIHNEDKSLWIIYNGEIYNYLEIREELVSKSHKFYTQSDTEVILHLYEQEGEDFVKRLNGMFAFALWDKKNEKLILARDRFGIKPLFYSLLNNSLAFSSELNPLLSLQEIGKAIDFDALSNYFSYNYIPEPNSIFTNIKKLQPGSILIYENNNIRIRQYWDLGFNIEREKTFQQYAEELDVLLQNSVKMMLRSDVPIGVFLSSGLDSSSIIAYMRNFIKGPIKTFTIGFDDKSYSEAKGAKAIAKRFETEHHEISLENNLIELIFNSIEHFGEPFGDNASLATMMLSKATSNSVKVVLTGDGGDEILAGYPTHYVYKIAALYKKIPSGLRERFIKKIVEKLPVSTDRLSHDYVLKRFVQGAGYSFQEAHFLWKAIFYDHEKEKLFTDRFKNLIPRNNSFSICEDYFDRVKNEEVLNQLLYVDVKTFLLSNGLVRVDRMTMANGVEARVPFLENNLVEFASTIPCRYKIRGSITKYILRKLIKDKLPHGITSIKKMGLLLPLSQLLAGKLKPFIEDTLAQKKIEKTGLLNPEFVSQLLREHFEGRKDNSRQIWNLAMFMVWFNKYTPVF
jgi:asparagine synthase (glutamine-hydrolysing)